MSVNISSVGKFHSFWEGWQKIWNSWFNMYFQPWFNMYFQPGDFVKFWLCPSQNRLYEFYLDYLYFLTKRKLCTKSWARFLILWEVRKEGENLKNQTLYAFRHPLMLVEIFTRFLFWLLILWGNTVCAINLSLPSFIFFRYFVYFVKDFSFFSVC